VSRSTVREALRLLASQHLIVTTRGVTGGSFVSHPDAEQLSEALSTGLNLLTKAAVGFADLLELRSALEIPAAALAAIRRTDAHLAEIRAALFDPDLDDFDVMLQAHATFHGAVAKATCNPLYELVTRPLYHVSYGEEVIDSLPEGYWARIDADHRALLAALVDRDAERARTLGRLHLEFLAEANQR
jgi:DNA-binding FadR family transcriptional regulator